MKLIVGLGNPGKKYEETRHNAGFMLVDALAKVVAGGQVVWQEEKRMEALSFRFDDFLFVLPQTFMNDSGRAVSKLVNFYKIPSQEIFVVHDDVDLSLGKLKLQVGGSSAGHHGVDSLIHELGTDQFIRLRVGIGRPGPGTGIDVERYVLEDFSPEEKARFKKMIKEGIALILCHEKK